MSEYMFILQHKTNQKYVKSITIDYFSIIKLKYELFSFTLGSDGVSGKL